MSYAGAKVNRRAQAAVALRGEQILAALAHGPAPLAEALARAGITLTTRRARAAYGVAAAALRARGLVCYTEGKSASGRVWRLVSPDEPRAQEEHQLADLDAVVRITTERRQTYGGTWRTEVSAVATLGPSWPATTPPPRWSTAFVDAQVKHGALDGAIPAALSRMRAVLSTLRADTTRNPNTEVPVSDNETISALLAYCASVSGGAKDSSVHSWLKARRVSRIRAEELLEQLVNEGRLQLVEKPIAGGEVVVRYLPADPAIRPAPLPVSDAPAEDREPAEEEAAEEPTLIGSVEEQTDPARAQIEALEARVRDLAEGNRDYRAQLAEARDRLHEVTAERDRLAAALDRERTAAGAPALDPGAVGQYLLTLPSDHWEALALARQQLAEALELAARAQDLEVSALAAVDSLLSAPAPPPPPAPEAAPHASPEGDTGESPGTMRDRVLRAFLLDPQREMRAADVAASLSVHRHAVTGPLSTLTADGKLKRVEHGVYRLARRLARRAA